MVFFTSIICDLKNVNHRLILRALSKAATKVLFSAIDDDKINIVVNMVNDLISIGEFFGKQQSTSFMETQILKNLEGL